MRITRVEGNYKLLRPTALDAVTFIQGPHQSGKSSVIQAIWLAWTDSIWDLDSDSRALYSSAKKVRERLSRQQEMLTVSVETTLGSIRYSNSTQKRRTLSEQLTALEQDERRWLACLPRIGAPISGAPALVALMRSFGPPAASAAGGLPDLLAPLARGGELPELLLRAAEAADQELPVYEQLLSCLAFMTSHKNVATGRAIGKLERQMTALLDRVTAYRPGEAERIRTRLNADVEARAAEAGAAAAQAGSVADLSARLAALRSQRETEASELNGVRAAESALRAQLTAAPVSTPERRYAELVLRHLKHVAAEPAGASVKGRCPTCMRDGIDSSQLLERWSKLQTPADPAGALAQQILADQHRALVQRLADLQQRVRDLDSAIATTQGLLDTLSIGSSAPSSSPYSGLPALQPAERAALEAELRRQEAAADAHREYEQFRLQVEALRVEQVQAKSLEGELRDYITALGRDAAAAAEAAAQPFMPAGLRVAIHLEPGAAFWGIASRAGTVTMAGALSGMEMAAVRVARMMAESSGAYARIILLDDAELGAIRGEARASMISSLRNAIRSDGTVSQLIMATTEDTGAGSDDLVIRLGEGVSL